MGEVTEVRSASADVYIDDGFTQEGWNLELGLLPITDGWQTPSLLDYAEYGYPHPNPALHKGNDTLTAVLRRWNEVYHAELCGFSTIYLVFQLPQPIQEEQVAWDVLVEQEAVAGDGHWAAGSYSYRADVRGLLSSPMWTLWYKP